MTRAKAIIIGAVIALLLLVGFVGFSFYRSMTAPPALEQVRLPESEELYDVPASDDLFDEDEEQSQTDEESTDGQDDTPSTSDSSVTDQDEITEDQAEQQASDALKDYQQKVADVQAKDPTTWTEEDKQLMYGINRELLTKEQREVLYGPSTQETGPTAIDVEKVLAEQQQAQQPAEQTQQTVEIQGEIMQVKTDSIVIFDGNRDWTVKSTKPWVWKTGDVVHCTGVINGDVVEPTSCVLA